RLATLNSVQCDLQPVAVGAELGKADLWFPRTKTQLGTVRADVRQGFGEANPVEHLQVPMLTLDAFCRSRGSWPDLLKIDTEGNELNVLQGAAELLATHRPWMILESCAGPERQKLFATLQKQSYWLCALPYRGAMHARELDACAFGNYKESNFLAVPA